MSNENKPGRGPILQAPLATEAIQMRRLSDQKPKTGFAAFKYNLQFMRGRGALEIGVVLAVILFGYITAAIINPSGFSFLNPNNLSGVVSQAIPVLAILGLAAGILMIAGEFDLSLGPAITFNAIVFIKASEAFGLGVGVLAGIASGVAIALVNGAIVVITKIPSFIATLGMSFFWAGASILMNGTTPAIISAENRAGAMEFLFAHDFGLFRSQLIWLIVVGVLAWFFMHRHRYGNHIYAVGGNAEAARRAGINVKRVRTIAFVLCSSLAAIAGMLFASRMNSISPSTGGSSTLLYAVGAAVIGGVSLFGGKGRMRDAILGGLVVAVIDNGMGLLGYGAGIQFLVTGAVLLVSAGVDAVSRRGALTN